MPNVVNVAICRKSKVAIVTGNIPRHSPPMWKSPAHTLRLVTLTEGVSFLLLLGLAMPLKYMVGLPLAVVIVGWIHGVLFVSLCLLLVLMLVKYRWPLSRAALVFIAALIPFGPFIIDRRLKDYEHTS